MENNQHIWNELNKIHKLNLITILEYYIVK